MGIVRNVFEDVTVKILEVRDKAVNVEVHFPDDREMEIHWFPKSVIEKINYDDPKLQTASIKNWILRQKEIVE